ncbi:recombinase family protein [Streptomyces spinosirectus]|uniref:recombinase family protein n=1 Tax=Streptomyces TaxID=1883 RepID=UPI001C9DE51C|nr:MULTISPECIES: recombinase family protein [Streptomyces]MBY8343118.1 recombinase family protein [Streptomyces plumbidurans]UIR18151.1 recombinase family protein [Streptomyces spinosirectus]
MVTRTRKRTAADQRQYSVEAEWTDADLALLEELKQAEALLPEDAPRALLSIRLSVLTDESTSPVRQELDLRILARERGCRVVGVASDLNVSATKVPPWKRKELGDWLNNRSPEFDELLFWKLDRFVRRLSDLSTMIEWSLKRGKNLVSKHDSLDLTTTAGKIMVTIIGGIAEIESANTSTRVASLWDYAKTQEEWIIGKPAYGYVTGEDGSGKPKLVIDPDAYKALHWARRMALRGRSARFMVRCLKRSGLMSQGLTVATLHRRLRNPALLGYRVEEDKQGGQRRSKPVLGKEGRPIKVGPPIFTEEEFETLGAALDKRKKNQPPRRVGGATQFLGVLLCADCKTNMTVQITNNTWGTYRYLRCRNCKSGGLGAPNPDRVYERLVEDVLKVLGDFPVQVRQYAEGAEVRREIKRLQESIALYMKELEPGGRYTKTRFTKEQAEATLDKLIGELEAIDPETAKDRWVNVHGGKTFREHWQEGGMEAMAADLYRVGIRCEVTRTKVPKVRAPKVHLRLLIPKDVRERLVIREDDFADAL